MPPLRLCASAALSLLLGCGQNRDPVDRILLVTVDTLRWDRVGYAGSDVETPNLDRLARSGASFTQAISSAPITLPAHSSILSGLYPQTHGTRHNGVFRLSDDVETLPEALKQAGFSTAAFIGAFVLDRRFGLEQGFDHYDDELPEENPVDPAYYAERRAEEVVARALRWIDGNREGRVFVWVHLYDPHAPHNPPPPFDTRYPGRDYEAEIAYTDFALGPLLEEMNDDRTAIVMTADHGEGLGEHGESTHTLFIYDSTMRVPLLLKAPGVTPGMRIERQTRAVDIAPTLLELAGLKPRENLDGVSLLPDLREETAPAVAAYGETFGTLYQFNWHELRFLRKDGFKFIEAPRPELYDLSADPKELENLWSENPPEVGRKLREELDAMSRGDEPAQLLEVDPETERRLESLGYVTSIPPRGAGERADPKDRVQVFERLQDLLSPDLSSEERIAGYHEILRLEPENTLARGRLANLLAEEGRLEEAVAAFRELVRVSEMDTNAWENMASALLLLNRTEEALLVTEQAVNEAPWYLELQVLRGEALEKAGRLEEALTAYAKAVELRPEVADNHWRHGTVALELGDGETAERDFRESLVRDASFEEGRLALARLLARSGRAGEAIELLGTPQAASGMAALADALLASGRFEEAKALLENAVRLEPENTRALALLGPLYGRDGELEKAARTLEKSMALGETSPEIRRNLALVYMRQGRSQAAIAELKRATDEAPRDPSLWFTLGNVYLIASQGARAADALEKALELRPEWPEATFNLGLAYQAGGRPERAAEAFQRFLASDGSSDPEKRAEAEKRLSVLARQGSR